MSPVLSVGREWQSFCLSRASRGFLAYAGRPEKRIPRKKGFLVETWIGKGAFGACSGVLACCRALHGKGAAQDLHGRGTRKAKGSL